MTEEELQELHEVEPEVGDEDEDVSSKKDDIDEELQPEEYNPANDGDDSILKEVVEEGLKNA
jgi:hypothetical protein